MKYRAIFTLFVFCFSQFFGYHFFVHASSFLPIEQRVSLDISWGTNQQMELSLSPDVFFWFETTVTNDTPDTLSNITYHTDFPNGIVYRSETPRAFPARNGNFLQWSISLDEFYPPSIPNYSRVLSPSNDLLPNDTFQIRRMILKFPKNWGVYENVLRNHFSANNGAYISDTKETFIYVNVKPHILDYYFEKSDGSQTVDQVQGLHSEPVNLIVKVKDYNGCENIAGGNIQANLSQLWLWSSETLSYISCEADEKTALFKKTGITTSVDLGDYTFVKEYFTAIDIDGNQNDASDTRFWNEDKKTSITLKVVESLTPVIDFVSLSESLIWWPEKQMALLTVSSSFSGSIKAVVWWDTSCESGVELLAWENYTENTQKTFQVDVEDMVEGGNTVYVCLEKEGYIGTLSRTITKDTLAWEISNPGYIANVWLNDTEATFSCWENGYFAWELLGGSTLWTGTGTLSWTQTSANTVNTYPILNTYLQSGQNIFHVFCKDEASNISYKTGSINKVIPVASMQAKVGAFWDFDMDYNGLDGRDITVSWTKPTDDMSSFSSYYIYLLPSNIDFDIQTHGNNYIGFVKDQDVENFTGTSSILKDSTLSNLVSWGSYKACVLIRWKDLSYWEVWCSSAATLTSDIVQNAKILSAKFTTNTNLELTTDTTLDSNLSNHSGAFISYVYNSTTLTPVSVASINGSKINLTIPDLNHLWAVWSNIIMLTWALRSAGGWYNNYFSSGSLAITDGQAPTVTGFSNTTPSLYNNFFSWSIDVWFTFGEAMKSWASTRIVFDRVSWNPSIQKSRGILDSEKLLSGTHIQDVDLVAIWLVSGTIYDMKLIGQDLAGNSVTSSAISVKFDNVWPAASTLTDAPNTSSQTPTLSWSASTDDSWNGSGVKDYILRIFNNSNCSWGAIQTLTSATNSKATNSLSNGTYSWNVYALDNMWNIGTTSSCDSFLVDTTIPTIDNQKITNTNNNSTTFTKSWNTIEITADLTNTDITKIKADLSSLSWNASHSWVLCSAPVSGVSCSYVWGKVTYSFMVWFAWVVSELVRQVKLIVSNISEINIVEKLASITVDNTSPTTWTISSPINQTYGWNSLNIAWSGISDNNLNYIKLEYSSNGGTDYNFIYSGANISPYNWNIWALTTGNNYKIKITAIDKSGNISITESQIFSLDKSNPTITTPVFITPISWNYIKWNTAYNITWNDTNITDNETLPANPITLEYSTNNGSNWNVISSTLPNTGSYTWTLPNINWNQAKLRIKARDNVWNESSYVESGIFTIDSQNPTFSITTWTPPNGAYINAWWFEALATAWDNIKIDKIYYSFKRNSNDNYWDGNAYTWVLVWNVLQDNIDSISYNLNELINPTIVNGENYDFILKVVDKAGNELSTTPRQYIADTINPNLTISNQDNSYFSGSIHISGTGSDTWAWLSSIKISIKKWTDFWNGSAWVWSEQILTTNTSNNYANWNYDFSSPGTDSDWQNYEVIVYAYDKSYKVNNTSSGSINTVLDKTGPIIENDIFSFTPSGFYAGGSNFDITWTPVKMTSSWAIYSHVKLEYNDDWVFSVIAWNTENDGSYSFNLPEIDDSITIIISAYDVLGNKSNTIASTPIFIDSTPPEISTLETMDMSANGQIDGLKVTMSENILDNTIVLWDYSVSGIGTPTSWETGNSANDNIFILKFADIWDTSTTPTLSYTKWSLTDAAWKNLESISNVSSLDTASPRILSAEISANNSWIFNKIEATFSENISSTTDKTAFILNNGLTISSVSTLWNKATLNLNLWSVNTDSNGYTLWFSSNPNWKDSSNNEAWSLWSAINLIDKAKPVLVSSIIKDSDSNYVADKIELTFSESLSWSLTWLSVNSWSVSNSSLVTNKITFDISWISGTTPDINISYSGSLEDNFSNILDSFSNIQIDEKISPKLESSFTLDQNTDGKMDGILLHFSEDLNANLWDISVWVNGYTTNNYSMSGSQNVIVNVIQKSTYDTDSTPLINLISNSLLKDINNNIVLSQNINSQDGVGPVIIWARYEPSTHKVFVNFSETINNLDFITWNFVLANAGSYTIDSVNIWEKSITLSNETINYSSSTISFVSNSVRDALGNKQSWTHYVSITAPIIINEIMVSNDINNNYIELHNLSSDIISLSGWTIAGITLPNDTISANGYYLISKTAKATSLINVDPDFVANIDLSWSEIVLNNGSIDIDTASLTTWLWDTWIPASIERKSPIWNALLTASWYKALVSNWFDNQTPLWTPKTANVFDTTSPNLTTNLTGNLLLPIWYYDIVYTYSDDILINTGSISFALEKWNWNSFENILWYSTWVINANNANFSLSWLGYGKYKASFSISDSAWNISNDTKEFYVDNFSFTISTESINLWILEPNNLKLASDLVEVEIKTIGAGFKINHIISSNDLWNWDTQKWLWACRWELCNSLEDYSWAIIENQVGELQSSWALKTYNYKIKYGAKIDSLKEAWIYQVDSKYKIEINY